MTSAERPQDVFGRRAAYYVSSQTHSDAGQLQRLVELTNAQPHWRLLDIGAGTGHTALALAPHVAASIGIDLTVEMLLQAQELAAARAQAVTWALADAQALPFADGSFELVACRRAAHHFVDITGALREMVRALTPGGLLLIDDRSIPDDDAVDALMNQLDVWHDASHIREYRASEWCDLVTAAGLQVQQIEGYVQHRPLSAFAHGAGPAEVAWMRQRLAAASPHERTMLALTQQGDEWAFNNWYLSLVAVKPTPAS